MQSFGERLFQAEKNSQSKGPNVESCLECSLGQWCGWNIVKEGEGKRRGQRESIGSVRVTIQAPADHYYKDLGFTQEALQVTCEQRNGTT